MADTPITVLINIPSDQVVSKYKRIFGYVAVSGTYSILATDVIIDCVSGTFVVTMPTAVGVTGKIYDIKNSGNGNITINTTSSQTIDDSASIMIGKMESVTLISDGANWLIL